MEGGGLHSTEWKSCTFSSSKSFVTLTFIALTNLPRPSMAFLSADTSSSTLKFALSLTVPLALDCWTTINQPVEQQHVSMHRRMYCEIISAPLVSLDGETYRDGERGGGVQEQVQVILQHILLSFQLLFPNF